MTYNLDQQWAPSYESKAEENLVELQGSIMKKRAILIDLVNKRDRIFELWRQETLINHMITKLETENSNIRGLEALLRSAFEAGWIGGLNHPSE
jgi:hypothetical protein